MGAGADHFREGGVAALLVDGRAQVREHPHLKAFVEAVEDRRPHAMVGGNPHHIKLVDAPLPQPLRQAFAAFGGSFEAGVGGGVGTFAEEGVEKRVV